jgi:hypothetical protein
MSLRPRWNHTERRSLCDHNQHRSDGRAFGSTARRIYSVEAADKDGGDNARKRCGYGRR